MMTKTDSYDDFLEQRSIAEMPSPMQLRQWARSKAILRAQITLRPCRSPYCECDTGKCTHPGCFDARHIPMTQGTQ